MIASLIAAILAAAKVSTALDSILRQFAQAYAVYAHDRNNRLKQGKDARNAALVAGVNPDDVWVGLCVRCPLHGSQQSASETAGQHGDSGDAP